MDDFMLEQIHDIERTVTKSMSGDKRAIIELYTFMPSLFERGKRTYTILEPHLYETNKIGMG